MTKILSKKDILAADDIKRVLVEVPEWGGSVYVAVMSGHARGRWEAESIAPDNNGEFKLNAGFLADMKVRLCALTIVGEDGIRIFGDKDIEALAKKNSVVIERIYDVACELNGIGEEEISELENFSAQTQVSTDGTG